MTQTDAHNNDVLGTELHAKTPLCVLLSANPEWGGVIPFLQLAKALREAGHTVLFSGPPPNEYYLRQCGVDVSQIIRAIEDQGFEYVTVFRSIVHHSTAAGFVEIAESGNEKWWMGLYRLLTDLLPGLIDDLEEVIKTRSVDVALVDSFIWYEAIAAAKCKIPIVSVNTSLRVPINFWMPPTRLWLMPSGLGSRIAILYSWAKIWIYWKLLLPWVKHLRPLYEATHQIQRLAADAGMKSTLSDYFPEFVLPELTLCPGTFDFFPMPGRFYTALLGPNLSPDKFSWPLPSGATTRIYCAAGTITRTIADDTTQRMMRMWLAALDGRPDISVILQVSDSGLRNSLKNVPSNITIVDWVDQRNVLDQADLAIFTGGLGTIKECISAGVPMLVTAPPQSDKPGNAMRVDFHRIGRQVNVLDTSSEEIRILIDDLLDRRNIFRANMRPIQNELLDPNEPQRFVQYVESLVPGLNCHRT